MDANVSSSYDLFFGADRGPVSPSPIKAIETVYNGYRFRSRLEARWAVFFDEVGIKYEYEPEGFNLSGGVKYLPDFYLPAFCVYVEIKPNIGYTEKEKALREEWEEKCRSFRTDTGRAICLFTGNPWDDHWNHLYAWDTTDSSGGEGDFEIRLVGFPRDWYYVDRANAIIAVADRRSDRSIYLDETFETYAGSVGIHNADSLAKTYPNACGDWVVSDLMTEFFDPKLKDRFTQAQLKARQARFEHGETP